MVVLGHGLMRFVAGPARWSPLAPRPWETAEPYAVADLARHVAFWALRFHEAVRVDKLGRSPRFSFIISPIFLGRHQPIHF